MHDYTLFHPHGATAKEVLDIGERGKGIGIGCLLGSFPSLQGPYKNRVRTSTAWEADLRACLSVQMLHRFNCIRKKAQVVHDPWSLRSMVAAITHCLTGPGHMDNVSNVFWEENVVNTSIAVGSIPIGVAG